MSRRLGEFVPLSVNYADDDAILSVSALAEVLFARALALAGRLHSDGYLTEAQVLHRCNRGLGDEEDVRELIAELVGQHLWLEVDGGYVVRSFLKWNKSAEELGRERARDRDRKRAERSDQDSLWDDTADLQEPDVRVDSVRTPGGIRKDSSQNPGGVRVDAPRGRARAGHGTTRHGTERHGVPPETAGQRVNRLARVYTDVVRISRFPAVAGIIRVAVNAGCDDETITTALKKIIAENRSLTVEALRIAIMGGPNGRGSPHQPYRNPSADDQSRYETEELRA